MNNFYLRDKIKDILETRKSQAINTAEMNKHFALQNEKFLKLENEIGALIIDVAKANFEKKDVYPYEKQIVELKIEQDAILNELGLKREDLNPKFCCSLCNDCGIVDGEKCKCYKQLLNELLKKECGMPLQNYSFDDCKDVDAKILDLIKNLCNSYPNNITYANLLLSGDTGVGKTCITQAMANYFIEKEQYTIFTTATNLVNDFLKYHTTFNEEKLHYFEPYLDCDVLIIDDLGTESILKNVTIEYLLNLINERQSHNKLTIITTNLTNEGIMTRYGERIFSRLFNKKLCICLELCSKDLRLKREK